MAKAPTFRRKRTTKAAGETPETLADAAAKDAAPASDAGMLNTEPSVVMPRTTSAPAAPTPPVAEHQRAPARSESKSESTGPT